MTRKQVNSLLEHFTSQTSEQIKHNLEEKEVQNILNEIPIIAEQLKAYNLRFNELESMKSKKEVAQTKPPQQIQQEQQEQESEDIL